MSLSWNKGIVLIVLLLSISVVYAADQFYSIKGGPTYNGSSDGWVMVWDAGATQDSYLRVAFSVNRPAYKLGKTVSVMIRTDGYYSRDSGWWYTEGGASVDYVKFYYPNGTLIKQLSGTTGSDGVWKDDTALMLTKDMPMGTYKVEASVTKGTTTVGDDAGGYMTIYFDVGGELHLTVNTNASTDSRGRFVAANGSVVRIYGQILQPNGDVFSSTTVPSGSAVTVRLGIVKPDESYTYMTQTTTTGDYSFDVLLDQVGHYFFVVTANCTVGGPITGIKYVVCEGRNQTNIISTGEWPAAGGSFASSPLAISVAVILAIISAYYPGGMLYRRLRK
jgi:hypothetical protein